MITSPHLAMHFFSQKIRQDSKCNRKQKRSDHVRRVDLMAEIFIDCRKYHTKNR